MYKKTMKVAVAALILISASQCQAVSIDVKNVPVQSLGAISTEVKGGPMSAQPGIKLPPVNGKQMLTYTVTQGPNAGKEVKLLIASYKVDNPPAEANDPVVKAWFGLAKARGNTTLVGLFSQYGTQEDWTPQGWSNAGEGIAGQAWADPSTYALPMAYSISANGDYKVSLPAGFLTANAIQRSIM